MSDSRAVPIPEFDNAADELQWLRDQYTLAINELMEYAKLIAAGGAEAQRLRAALQQIATSGMNASLLAAAAQRALSWDKPR